MSGNGKEIMELGHDPVPGYRPIFFVTFAVGVIYLAMIFYYTF